MTTFEGAQAFRPTSPRYSHWGPGRTITRRGVLWLGLKCDIRCKFCYDEQLARREKAWLPVDALKASLYAFRHVYQNEFVDFMGGEPTLHPRIFELVGYAREIGLLPTCITHGLHLGRPGTATEFRDAGIHDFLVSVHGVGDRVDVIHGGGKGNFAKQLAGLIAVNQAGIPIRFNVTMIKDNVDQLPDIARLGREVGASVINFLTYNPYFEWSSIGEIPFQAQHSEIAPFLKRAIDVCNDAGVEANVRYMPICQMKGYESHMYTGVQLPYDPHEWDYNSWYGRTGGKEEAAWYAKASQDQRRRHSYCHPGPCGECAVRAICDGVHAQYYSRWGDAELDPYSGEPVSDPTHFIERQVKLHYQHSGHVHSGMDAIGAIRPELTQFAGDFGDRAGTRSEGGG